MYVYTVFMYMGLFLCSYLGLFTSKNVNRISVYGVNNNLRHIYLTKLRDKFPMTLYCIELPI